jgi:hypothetical protein
MTPRIRRTARHAPRSGLAPLASAWLALACLAIPLPLATATSQNAPAENAAGKAKKPKESKEPKPFRDPAFFQSAAPVAVTFTTNIRQIRRDKSENAPWRWASLTYQDSAGKSVQVPLRVRTRGIWRLKNCAFPPIRLNFSDKTAKGTLFENIDEPKLVNYCQDNEQYERYILQEFQLYRIYQLLTPASHRVRLLRMTYADSANGKREAERYAFLVEDPGQLAKRLSAKPIKLKGATPGDFDPDQLALAYLFEYFIGNLDFSWSGLHNTELLGTEDGRVLPVAYDFDYAGAVNAWYATPPPNYGVPNVRTRKFLGPCEIAEFFPSALTKFVEKKDAIYALYHDEIGQLMPSRLVQETLQYFDDFYNATRTPDLAKRNVFSRCIQPG